MWWICGILVVALVAALLDEKYAGKRQRPSAGGKPRTRIDHLHYISGDEYECSVCGRTFDRDTMSCPYCGVRFTRTERDEDPWIEEFEEESAWDEEDGL